MRCKIADLIVEIPAAGGMVPRCKEYLCDPKISPDIVIREEDFCADRWSAVSAEMLPYMETGQLFYIHLLKHSGLMLHASAVELDGKAYLFSGDCGAGKSTHTALWQQVFGVNVQIFNDDKPALRCLDGTWYAYGTPWCGKNGININTKVPLAGICFLRKADSNRIRRISAREALPKIFKQTIRCFDTTENLDLMLAHVDKLVRKIPVFELENRPEPEAAQLSYETMRCCAKEMGL